MNSCGARSAISKDLGLRLRGSLIAAAIGSGSPNGQKGQRCTAAVAQAAAAEIQVAQTAAQAASAGARILQPAVVNAFGVVQRGEAGGHAHCCASAMRCDCAVGRVAGAKICDHCAVRWSAGAEDRSESIRPFAVSPLRPSPRWRRPRQLACALVVQRGAVSSKRSSGSASCRFGVSRRPTVRG